jgi:hypothetical protein
LVSAAKTTQNRVRTPEAPACSSRIAQRINRLG